MSGRLDQSLDAIIDGQKKAKREARNRTRKPNKAGVVAKTAPVGGVKKSTKPAKPVKGTPTGATAAQKESKIVVSGLPYDVNEIQIKEYFQKSVGNVKKVSIQYDQNGKSRGIADIRFVKPGSAAKAAKDLNGMLVDKRPMKIEVVVDASHIPEPAPTKSLGDRVAYAYPRKANSSAPLTNASANPKAQPKSATSTKAIARDGTKGRSAGKPGKPKRGRNANRPKPKTTEELDAEMTDYWGTNNGGATATMTEANAGTINGAATAVGADGDMGMDEISVGSLDIIT